MNRETLIDIAVFLLRVVAGLFFLQHGGVKIFGWFGGIPNEMTTLIMVGGIIELVGGAAVLLGVFVRPVAFILAGEMAVAYFMFHHPQGMWPLENGGEIAALFCFIFLFFAAYGGGRFVLKS